MQLQPLSSLLSNLGIQASVSQLGGGIEGVTVRPQREPDRYYLVTVDEDRPEWFMVGVYPVGDACTWDGEKVTQSGRILGTMEPYFVLAFFSCKSAK